MNKTTNYIEIGNVTKTFNQGSTKAVCAVKNISLSINKGEFFIILGPSGCGKSTLLRLMSGLEDSFDGKISYEDNICPGDFGFVFQSFALFPWLTVYENIELGLNPKKLNKKQKAELVEKELKRFDLARFAKSYPRELSGGMKQRVGIARAWIANPKIIFMDEPFSELDSFTAEELRKEVLAIWQEEHPTIVMVTHLIGEAIELADRIAVLTPRPGTVEKIIENKIARPRNRRSKEFFELEDKLTEIIKP